MTREGIARQVLDEVGRRLGVPAGASVWVLEGRAAYGGRKGGRAARRLRAHPLRPGGDYAAMAGIVAGEIFALQENARIVADSLAFDGRAVDNDAWRKLLGFEVSSRNPGSKP